MCKLCFVIQHSLYNRQALFCRTTCVLASTVVPLYTQNQLFGVVLLVLACTHPDCEFHTDPGVHAASTLGDMVIYWLFSSSLTPCLVAIVKCLDTLLSFAVRACITQGCSPNIADCFNAICSM